METFLVSTSVVALGEIGDKTQLLAMVLAARYNKPFTICLGILIATLANHALAGIVGQLIAAYLNPDALRWVLGISFIALAAWLLVPDSIDEESSNKNGMGVLLTTIVMFFLAEMGDKTQVATIALAARYDSLTTVVLGSTFGMMLANVPAVYMCCKIMNKLPLKLVHGVAALIFLIIGLVTLFDGIPFNKILGH